MAEALLLLPELFPLPPSHPELYSVLTGGEA